MSRERSTPAPRPDVRLCKMALALIFHPLLEWSVEYTDEFGAWWNDLSVEEQEDVDASVGLLERYGPALKFPHSLYALYAFDPIRSAILLVGGEKTGNDRWYETFVPQADRLFSEHLRSIDKKGKP